MWSGCMQTQASLQENLVCLKYWYLSIFFPPCLDRRCKLLPLQRNGPQYLPRPVLSGNTASCCRGGNRAAAPQGVSFGIRASALGSVCWNEVAEFSGVQRSFLLTSAGSWQHAEGTATHTHRGKRAHELQLLEEASDKHSVTSGAQHPCLNTEILDLHVFHRRFHVTLLNAGFLFFPSQL